MERERLLRFRSITKITEVQTVGTTLRTSIQLRGGGTFGRVEDLVISDRGRVDFLVAVFEEKLIAVPFSLTRVDFERQVVIIDVERELLLRAPSFTRDRFPNLSASSQFAQQVNTFFKVPTGGREQPAEPRRPTTRTPEKRLPETQPPEKRVPQTRPPEKRLPETQPPKKRPPESPAPKKRPPESSAPEDNQVESESGLDPFSGAAEWSAANQG